MHPAFKQIEHRPWPVPAEPWVVSQGWRDLAFIHYAMDADALRGLLPAGLELETFDGKAWVGVVPFEMVGVTGRWLYGLACMARFAELNLRTYVRMGSTPGVWFFSLDTTSAMTVLVGRRKYGLPYHRARMSIARKDGWFVHSSSRLGGGGEFDARFRAVGPVFYPKAGSFEHWVAERYCLYVQVPSRVGGVGLTRIDVHHVAWPLQKGEAQVSACTLFEAAGLPAARGPAVCHFSTGVEAVSYGARVL